MIFRIPSVVIFLSGMFNLLQAQDLWTLEYEQDEYAEPALLDLRYFNEDEAGQNEILVEQLSDNLKRVAYLVMQCMW